MPTWCAAIASVPCLAAMIAVIIKPIRMKTCSKNTLYPTLTRLMNAAIVGLIFVLQNIAKVQESVLLCDGKDAHHTSDNRSCDGCQCHTLNAECREPEMAVDQKIIQNNINRI